MDNSLEPADAVRPFSRISNTAFEIVEHSVYIALAALLSVTAVLALLGALGDWSSSGPILLTIDRLLFALMLIEILHTVRASIRSGALTPEPFLVVGLIASIRRMLAITLESSQQTRGANWSDESAAAFRAAMTELVVLGGLILILVVSIFLLRRRRAE